MRKLMILLSCVLAFSALSACGKGKTDDPNNASDASQATFEEKMRQFAQCMRDHGIQMEDPHIVSDGDGGGSKTETRIEASAGPPGAKGVRPEDESFKKAEEECRHLMPQGGEMGEANPEAEEQMRQFSKCMRENGVENFPDPQPGGGIAIGPDNGVNPDDPAFKEAEKKCQELMPAPKEKVTS
jgi:hypothetical protein